MSLFEKHKSLIDRAIQAVHERTFYAAFPELPKAYGDEAPLKGAEIYKNYAGKNFELTAQGNPASWEGEEVSPYTQEPSGIKYPIYKVEDLIAKSEGAFDSWKETSPAERAGILTESLEKIKEHFFDIALATQHTTGQSWIMSFQASGPHAADRSLETIALGYYEQTRFPEKVIWEKPMGKFSVKLEKTFVPKPKGIGLVIGCSTFPVWNSLPGIYASLITGNAVIVKPHPATVLPMAISVEVFRVDLVLVLKNVVRNAVLAVGRSEPPRRIGVEIQVDLLPTGEENVVLRVLDSSPEVLTTEEILERRVDRGLGLVTAALTRYDGAILVEEAAAPYRKAICIRFFRAFDREA